MSFNRSLLSQITKDLKKKPSKPNVPKNQWQHPGEITTVNSPNITMDAVDYPVLGVPNIGTPQMMYPNQQYSFAGASNVTEYPIMGKGGLLSKSVTCSSCGHSWKVTDGGLDPLSCHKCGGTAKMQGGGEHGGLDRWFAEDWVDVKTGKECGRQEGESRKGYPACRPSKRVNSDTPKTASELSSAEREKFKREKTSSQRISYNHKKQMGGFITDYDMYDSLDVMKSGGNVPTNPSLWSRAKAAAKAKYDVYPSAYANGFAAKWYKSKGGGWRKAEYGMEVMGEGGIPNNPGFNALPDYVQQQIVSNMAVGGYMPEMGSGGYVVTRSNDRKGKTHKVTGPDGTVKYFGDSKLGQHPKDPERKKAFYARHKKNLEGNPFFRAFARKTWADGGQLDMMQPGGAVGNFINAAKAVGNYMVNQPDSNAENIAEIFDPFGTSSWDDVIRAYNETGVSTDTALEVLGAVPFFGKLGQLSKPGIHLKKYQKFDKALYKNLPKNSVISNGFNGLGAAGKVTDTYQAYDQYKQYGGVQKYQEAGQVIKPKDGYIDLSQYGYNPLDKEGIAKAEELNKMYPGSKFVCTAKGCADIARQIGEAKGYDFGRNNAWGYRTTIPELYTAPGYKAELDAGKPLHDPKSYAFPEEVKKLSGVLVGLNRKDNYDGKMAKTTAEANDSRDYNNINLYSGPNAMNEHIGYFDNGMMYHGTAGNKKHPTFYVIDDPKDGIALPGIAKYNVVNAMGEPSLMDRASNTFNSVTGSMTDALNDFKSKFIKQKGGSIYDYMTSQGRDASFSSRKKLFDKYFDGSYTGTSEQNQAMLAMLQGMDKKETTPAQKDKHYLANQKRAIRNSNTIQIEGKTDKRNILQKALGLNEEEVMPYNFEVPRDVAEYYNFYQNQNQDKKFGIVSKQNAQGYFFDEYGNLVVQDEVGLGSDKGDEQPIFYKRKTTPSGAYTMKRGNSSNSKVTDFANKYGSNNFFYMEHTDPNKRLLPSPDRPNMNVSAALHGVPTHLEVQRLPRFNNDNLEDNRMSAGCINCRKKTLDNPYFTNIPQDVEVPLYITPERRNGGSAFYGNASYKKGGYLPKAVVGMQNPFFPDLNPEQEAADAQAQSPINTNSFGIYDAVSHEGAGIAGQMKAKILKDNTAADKKKQVEKSNPMLNPFTALNAFIGGANLYAQAGREESNRQMLRSQNATWNQQYDSMVNRGDYSQGPSSYGLYKPDQMSMPGFFADGGLTSLDVALGMAPTMVPNITPDLNYAAFDMPARTTAEPTTPESYNITATPDVSGLQLDPDKMLEAIAGTESGSKKGQSKVGMRTNLIGDGGKRATASGTFQITDGTLKQIYKKDQFNSVFSTFNAFKQAFDKDPQVEYQAARSLAVDHIKNYGVYALGAWYYPDFASRAAKGDMSVMNQVPRADYGNRMTWGQNFNKNLSSYKKALEKSQFGGEMELTMDEINQIKAMGGKVEFF